LNDLICGDNIKVLKTMEDNSIDLIVTSPPYNNWRNRRTQKNKKDYWDRYFTRVY
jgi:DNA modification methylase